MSWIPHILKIIEETQNRGDHLNSSSYLDPNCDLTFAILFMKMTSLKIKFMTVEEYKKKLCHEIYKDFKAPYNPEKNHFNDTSWGKNKNNLKYWGGFCDGDGQLFMTNPVPHWIGHITFYGLDDGYINESWQGPDPINLRYYLQRTIREEIDKEYISSGSSSPLSKSGKKYNKIREQWFNLLQVFVEKTSTPEKITILLNSIKDVIEKGFYKYD